MVGAAGMVWVREANREARQRVTPRHRLLQRLLWALPFLPHWLG